MNVLAPKYAELTEPSMMPIRHISGSLQSGHQLWRATGSFAFAFAASCRGDMAIADAAIIATGTLQATNAFCHVPTMGMTSVSIRAPGRVSPIIIPLV